jgi:ABC-type dipeptide/oligopeptide/nickel transport system permease subunit
MAQLSLPANTSKTVEAAKLAAQSQSQWGLAWRRFKRNRLAVFSGFVLIAFVLIGLFAPIVSPQNPLTDNSGKEYIPPFFIAQSPAGKTPEAQFILGTDDHGRDLLSRLIYGTRTSLLVGLLPTGVVLLVGTLIGFVAGLAGGTTDNALMRVTDVFYAFPDVLLLILANVAFGDTAFGKTWNGLLLFVCMLGIVSWSGLARLMRGSALSIKTQDFISAAKSLGMSDWDVMMRHILPNSLSVMAVWAALAIPSFVLTETVLGFLGVGLRPALELKQIFVASWGRLLLDGRSNIESQPWFLICVTATIALFVIAFTFFGNGVRDALDPRQK